jgi:hypothetical protein
MKPMANGEHFIKKYSKNAKEDDAVVVGGFSG